MPDARLAWTEDLDALGAIETELAPPMREALQYVLTQLDLEPDAWLVISPLRQVITLSSALEIIERLTAAGATQTEATIAAGHRLGVPPKTIETWLGRWRGAIRKAESGFLHTEGGPNRPRLDTVRESKTTTRTAAR